MQNVVRLVVLCALLSNLTGCLGNDEPALADLVEQDGIAGLKIQTPAWPFKTISLDEQQGTFGWGSPDGAVVIALTWVITPRDLEEDACDKMIRATCDAGPVRPGKANMQFGPRTDGTVGDHPAYTYWFSKSNLDVKPAFATVWKCSTSGRLYLLVVRVVKPSDEDPASLGADIAATVACH